MNTLRITRLVDNGIPLDNDDSPDLCEAALPLTDRMESERVERTAIC